LSGKAAFHKIAERFYRFYLMFESVRQISEGFGFHVRGIRFSFRNLSFLGLCTFPFLMTLTLYVLGFYIFTLYADDLLNLAWHIEAGERSKYIGWLYWAYMHIVKFFLYVLVLVLMFYTFIIFSNILASPVYDHISAKYEQACCQHVREGQAPSSSRGMFTIMKEELKKAVLMLVIPLTLLFIPVIGAFLGFVVGAVFIAWDYVDFSLSRDYPLLKDRIRALWRHKFFLLGFGCPLLIPLLGLMILPFAILSGTKLYFDKMKGGTSGSGIPID
jgi:uncharacterized protein involved in cysteine biosynthesis